ncbi:hypothetical protein [Shewanella sp. UCD-KL12]|uniref:hypothetical protein n=1 Tax=Shewanella sp. UCD-KL12 TaxID=1917163 RepID=UPI000970CF1F|nr:hypothetical protein [Shewanella sp. UCD-KL12]
MKNIYKSHIQRASQLNDAEKLSFLTSVLRSLLQTVVVTSFELIQAKTPSDEIDLVDFTNRFCKPSDGLPLQILDNTIPFLREYVAPQLMLGWFEKSEAVSCPLGKQLVKWVEFRNKRSAHGVLDDKVVSEWATRTEEIIYDCLEVFHLMLPIVGTNNSIKLPEGIGSINIETPLLYKGSAVVILSAKPKKGIWKLAGQVLSYDNAEEFIVQLSDNSIFSIDNMRLFDKFELSEITSNDKEYSFYHNFPVRQTDTFEGRTEELKNLEEWMDDEDSRYCLVYGDGGYGKTTLVLELLNQFKESNFDFNEPIPEIICYHTAKLTKWTEQGLTHFTGITPAMDECIRELMRCFYSVLPAEWYSISGRALIDKAVGVIKENKYNRNDILLILDNTETLATSAQEVKDLGVFFKLVGKLIGRLIITSRRREFIEATPIPIEGLTEIEAVSLMQRIAQDYSATPILQAGDSKLRRVSNQLMRKPLLLEALVKYVSYSQVGIDAAIENIFRKNNAELLEFLYEDAWARMNPLQKEAFLILVHVKCPLDQVSIGQICQQVGIQNAEFQQSLVETHFANLTDYGRTYSLEVVDLASQFFMHQYTKFEEKYREKIKLLALQVEHYAVERERIEKEYQSDRVDEAFRSEYARAAKVLAGKGDIDGAVEMYELAIEDDPLNSALFDRFAWLLFNKTTNYPYAKEMGEKAVELDPLNCDALVDLALINYRLEDLVEGDKYIDRARNVGRPESFCLLRKAIARYYQADKLYRHNDSIAMLAGALEMLKRAEKTNVKSDGYSAKNLDSIIKFKGLVSNKINKFNAKKVQHDGALKRK